MVSNESNRLKYSLHKVTSTVSDLLESFVITLQCTRIFYSFDFFEIYFVYSSLSRGIAMRVYIAKIWIENLRNVFTKNNTFTHHLHITLCADDKWNEWEQKSPAEKFMIMKVIITYIFAYSATSNYSEFLNHSVCEVSCWINHLELFSNRIQGHSFVLVCRLSTKKIYSLQTKATHITIKDYLTAETIIILLVEIWKAE